MKRNGKSVFTGTFIGELESELQAIMKKGDYVDVAGRRPIQPSDHVIGELTDLEKAMDIWLDDTMKKKLEICDACRRDPNPTVRCAEAGLLFARAKRVAELRWNIIRERLKTTTNTISIRQSFKIVEEQTKPEQGEMPDIEVVLIAAGLADALER